MSFLLYFGQSLALPVPLDATEKLNEIYYLDKIPLILKGSAVYRKYFFAVYELSLYLTDKTLHESEILTDRNLKFARMRFMRSVDSSTIRNAFLASFQTNCLENCELLAPYLKIFLEAVPNFSDGNVIEFSFYPDRTLVSLPGVNSLEIDSAEFGNVILRTWIGDNPPSKKFKRKILGEDR